MRIKDKDRLFDAMEELDRDRRARHRAKELGQPTPRFCEPVGQIRDKENEPGRWKALAIIFDDLQLATTSRNLERANRALDGLEPVLWDYAPVPERIVQALKRGNQAPGA